MRATLFPCTTLSVYKVNAWEVYNVDSSFMGVLHEKVKAEAKAKAEIKAKAEEKADFFIGRILRTKVGRKNEDAHSIYAPSSLRDSPLRFFMNSNRCAL